MRRIHAPWFAFALLATLAAAPPVAVAGEDAGPVVSANFRQSDPCGFYRGQAYGRGLDHFLTEMLWACEAVASRRSAGMPLSDRLTAVELALERYRSAVTEAVAAESARPGPMSLGGADALKASLASQTGALAALDGIRTGF